MKSERRDSYDTWRNAKFRESLIRRVVVTAAPTQGTLTSKFPIAGVTEWDGTNLIGSQFYARLILPHSQTNLNLDDFLVAETRRGAAPAIFSGVFDPNGANVTWQEVSPSPLSFPVRITGTIAAGGGFYSGTGFYSGVLGDFQAGLFPGSSPCIIWNILEPFAGEWVLGTSVGGLVGFFAGFDASTPPKPVMHVYESCPLLWQDFMVTVSVDNGVTTWGLPTYTAKDAWGATLGTGLVPLKPRGSGNMVPPNGGGAAKGVGFFNGGAFFLWDVGEYPAVVTTTVITGVNFTAQTVTTAPLNTLR